MAMMAPSNSVPRPVLMVVGEKDFQMMLSHTLVAMKSEIAEPRPYLLGAGVNIAARRGGRHFGARVPRQHAARRCEERQGAAPLLEELVEADDDDAREEKLADDEHRVAGSEVLDVAVHAREHVRHGLDDGNEDAEQLLRALEERLVLLGAHVDVDHARALRGAAHVSVLGAKGTLGWRSALTQATRIQENPHHSRATQTFLP
jgi:hypothetical protein